VLCMLLAPFAILVGTEVSNNLKGFRQYFLPFKLSTNLQFNYTQTKKKIKAPALGQNVAGSISKL